MNLARSIKLLLIAASIPTIALAAAAPKAPTSLSATPISFSQVNLSWVDASSNEDGFRVERATSSSGPWINIGTVGANLTDFSSMYLLSSTTYYYRVFATSSQGDSPSSNVVSATTQAAPPAAPSGLSAAVPSSSQIDLSWTDRATNETGYTIERAATSTGPFSTIATLGSNVSVYSNTGLTSSTTYYYRVCAFNSAAQSPYSSVVGATTTASITIPSAPSGLTATAGSSSQINLGWTDNSTNEQGFSIERAGAASGPWSVVATGAAASYVNTGLTPSTTYYYRVRAYNTAGNSAYTPVASATTGVSITIPAAPTSLTATAASSSQINLGWTDNSTNEQGFSIERAGSASGPWSVVATGAAPSYVNTGLNPSTAYYYRVRAYNTAGSSSYTSVASATTMPPSIPAVPTGLTTTPFSSSQINLSWAGSATSFKVEHATSSTGPWSLIGTTGSTSFQDTSLSGCSTWFYHVSACNASGSCSAFSGASSATTQTTVPSAPTSVSASSSSSSQVNLSWTSSSSCSASSYKIERAPASTGPWSQIGTATAMSYQDSGLTASTAYYYHVRATNSVGDSAFSSSATATTLQVSTQLVPWSQSFGSTSDDRGHAIAIDGADNTYATGHFTGTVSLGGVSLTSALISVAAGPSQDCFLAKYSSTGQVSWAKTLGADGNDAGNGVAVDGGGDVTVVGQAGGWMLNFGGPTHYTFGGLDAFIAKYSSTGSFMWSKLFGSGTDDGAMAVATDTNGNVIATGFFQGTIYPGVSGSQPTLVSAGNKDVFLVKYSPTGTLIWARRIGGAGIDTGYAVSVDASGNVIVAGAFQSSADFGGPSSLVSAGGYDIFVAKYSSVDGSYIWAKRFGGSTDDVAFAVTVDKSGNVSIGGSFQGSVDFGAGALTSAGGTDAFVASYSSSGGYLWSRRGGGASNDRTYGVAADGMNNVFATGYFQGTADFAGSTFGGLGMDMFAVKYSPSGANLWSVDYGGGSTQIGNAIAARSNGNIAVTGCFDYTIDLGSGQKTYAGGMDAFVGTNIITTP